MATEHDEDVEVRVSDADSDAHEKAEAASDNGTEALKGDQDSLDVEAPSKPQASASEDDRDTYESCGGTSDDSLTGNAQKKKRKKKSKLGLDGTVTEPEEDIVPISGSEPQTPDTAGDANSKQNGDTSKIARDTNAELSAKKSGTDTGTTDGADGEKERKHRHHRTHTYSRETSHNADAAETNQFVDEDDKARAKRERKEARKALKEQLRKERKVEKEIEEAARLKREAEERARIEAQRIAEEKRRKLEHHQKMKAAKLAKRDAHVKYLERMLTELQTRLANARLDLERVQDIDTDDSLSDTSIDTDTDTPSDSDSDSYGSSRKKKSSGKPMGHVNARGPPMRTRPPSGARPLSGGRGMHYGPHPNRNGPVLRVNSRGQPVPGTGPLSREGSTQPAAYGGPGGPPGPPHMQRPHSRGNSNTPQRNHIGVSPQGHHLPPAANSRAQTLYSSTDPQSYGVDAKSQLEADMDQYRRITYEKAKGSERVAAEDLDAFSTANEGGRQTQVTLRKTPDESLGFMITETSRSSLLPCVFVSHIYPGGAASRSHLLHVGDTILAVNGVSLVGLPFKESLKLFKDLSVGTEINLTVVPVDPAVTVTIDRRMSPAGKLGLDVLHAEIVAVDRGGAAEIAGVKPGHLILEVNGQSVVGWDHESIVRSMKAEIVTLKTMPRDLFATLMKHETSRLEKKPKGANRNI
ncbi:hypothetical protein SARC_03031 [Sphaeroforma arctica JP610]|uniref:PDZ domain-containing protein n=1 Tax=Sphaeroforma arctica JP610 TaxID=667725 RepID=A0A0L0G6W6_9EUKA|nr:hypothetical protein SARC_03031 [Sphaeroforma arctica JP610]KNC84760.1 hypothetical protein SARC_03031 [Sphaeroforma arctica JP610]|eukprot:XP_014158662.1 hypothetical protein SARC_03031 [Sphaeroforma arctica JP610]